MRHAVMLATYEELFIRWRWRVAAAGRPCIGLRGREPQAAVRRRSRRNAAPVRRATPLPIVAPWTDCAVRGAEDVEDHADDEEDRTDAVEDAGAGDESEKHKDDSEEDHASAFSRSRRDVPARQQELTAS